VREADEMTVWKLKKFMDTTQTSTFIATLDGTAASTDEKAEILQSTFFPSPLPTDLSDIEAPDYPEPISPPPRITPSQVETAIEKLSTKKAPGPGEIPTSSTVS
jgi:hypothetical protein